MSLIIPEGYSNVLGSVENTEKAIKAVKDMFQDNLSAQLALLRVTAPMTVLSGTGLNDDLNGIETPVTFNVKAIGGAKAEIVHSLAKWKRMKLYRMGLPAGRGIYTDMNALRPEEELDNIHSVYVDQWDWEKVISAEQRNLAFLKKTVRRIYEAVKVTENKLYVEFPQIEPMLPEDIFFIHSEELLKMYPDLSPKERETEIVRQHKAVFIIGIGAPLSDGIPHDGRAAEATLTTTHTTSCAALYTVNIQSSRMLPQSCQNLAFTDRFAAAHNFSVGRMFLDIGVLLGIIHLPECMHVLTATVPVSLGSHQ